LGVFGVLGVFGGWGCSISLLSEHALVISALHSNAGT